MYKNMNNDMKPTYTLIFILKSKLKRGHDTTIAKHWKQDSVRNLFLMSIYCGRVGALHYNWVAVMPRAFLPLDS